MAMFRSPESRRPPGIAEAFARRLALVVAGLALLLVLGLGGFRAVLGRYLLDRTAGNYAALAAIEARILISSEEDPEHWELSAAKLFLALNSRLHSPPQVRLKLIGKDGEVLADAGVDVRRPSGRPARGSAPVIYNGETIGTVQVNYTPLSRDFPDPLGLLLAAKLASFQANNYSAVVAANLSSSISKMSDPDLWEYDLDKLKVVVDQALRLGDVARIRVLNLNREVVLEKADAGKDLTRSLITGAPILLNGQMVGSVELNIDFPIIRQAGLWLLALLAGLSILGCLLIYSLPIRIVRKLERDINAGREENLRLLEQAHAELELKVSERTRQLAQSNRDLSRSLSDLEEATEHARAIEARMRQSEKLSAVGQLAAGVAHEINNPLGVILGFAQTLACGLKAEDELELPIRSIEREALRCKALVQNLLTFARTSHADRAPMDVNPPVEQALALIEPHAKMSRVVVSMDLAPGLPMILGNKNQLEQVIVNLAKNAIDAMPNGGALTVSSWLLEAAPNSWVCLRFVDDGAGIPPAVASKIFDPFFTTKPVGQGTGLGLSLVSEIVHKHAGEIAVESRPGRTEFTVKLPARIRETLTAGERRGSPGPSWPGPPC